MNRINVQRVVPLCLLMASCNPVPHQETQAPETIPTQASEATPTAPIGRYQLTAAQYQLGSDKGVAIELPGVFLIDTQTGATWVYSELIIGGKRDASWRRTEMPDGIGE